MFTTPLGVRPAEIQAPDPAWLAGAGMYNGTDARDMRHALAGLVTTPGVLDGLTVTGSTEFEYVISRGHYAVERPDNGGIILGANDAEERVFTQPAPGTGSRIDIIYIQTREEEGTSEPYPFVASGTASGTPAAPPLPVGALEIARKVVAAGDVNTNSGAPVTYTNTKRAHLAGNEPVYAHLMRSSSNPNISASTSTDVTSWPESIKQGVAESNGVITIPRSGRYSVEFGLTWANNSTGNRAVRVYKVGNSTPVLADLRSPASGAPTSQSGSRTLILNAGDQLRIEVNQTTSAALQIQATTYPMFFTVTWIGAS